MAKGACMAQTHIPLAHSPEWQREDRMSRSPSRMRLLFPIVTVYGLWEEDTQRIVTNQQMTVGYLRNQESGGIWGLRGHGQGASRSRNHRKPAKLGRHKPRVTPKTSAC